MTGWDSFDDAMSDDSLRDELKNVSSEIAHFINTKIKPIIESGKKILAIKKLRDESGFSLRLAKRVVDAMTSGAELSTVQYGDPRLIDAIEYAEQACKQAIRAAGDDNKAAVALLGIRDQLADLWTDMVELPLRPEPVSEWEKAAQGTPADK